MRAVDDPLASLANMQRLPFADSGAMPERFTSSAKPRPTIRDVAAIAGVSVKSVSRVLNGESYVSAELRSRVRAAIDQLDYRLNMHASLLRRGHDKRMIKGTNEPTLSDRQHPTLARRRPQKPVR